MPKKKHGVWIMELDRFGYTLRVVAKSKDEALCAMQAEYINAYAEWNNLDLVNMTAALFDPVRDEDGEVDEYDPYNEFAAYYRAAFEDNDPRFYEFGKVEWE